MQVDKRGIDLWRSAMNVVLSSFSESRCELLTGSFTGVVPAACDAESGESEEVLLYRMGLLHSEPASAGDKFSVGI